MSVSGKINLNTFSQLISKLGSLSFAFLTTLLLRRSLGLASFGNYILVFNLIALLVSFSDFGTHLVSVKEYSQNPGKGAKILGSILTMRLLLALATVILFLFLTMVFFKDESVIFLTLIASPLVFLILLKNSFLILFHCQLKLYLSSLQDLAVSGLVFLAALAVSLTSKQLSQFIILVNLAYFIPLLGFGFLALSRAKIFFKPDWVLLKKIIWQSLPLGMVLSLFTIYSKIDTLILQFYTGSQAVGVYGLSYKMYENLTLPAAFLMNSIFPVLANNIGLKKIVRVKYLLQSSFDLLITSSLIIIFFTYLLAPILIKILVGFYSWPEIICLRILTLSLPFAFLNHLTGYSIIASNQQKKSLLIAILALIFNILANLIFVPLFSYTASAIITVLTEGLVLGCSLLVIKKYFNFLPKVNNLPKTLYLFYKTKGEVFE